MTTKEELRQIVDTLSDEDAAELLERLADRNHHHG